jgi:alanine-glyoxylate transaminase/(R)-3-amino-2-methylpropionate-pyruvate transaminase
VYLVNSGSEANELAILLARLHSGNQDIVSIENCYHGVSGNVHGLTAQSAVKFNNQPTGSFVHHVMCPDVYRGIWGGNNCRDSPVQTHRCCECKRDRCQAADMYYEQLKNKFSYSLPRGKVAGFFAESIQVSLHQERTQEFFIEGGGGNIFILSVL